MAGICKIGCRQGSFGLCARTAPAQPLAAKALGREPTVRARSLFYTADPGYLSAIQRLPMRLETPSSL